MEMKRLLLFAFIVGLSLWLGWPPSAPRYDSPPKAFAFASETLATERIRDLSRRHAGNVLIGLDANSEHRNALLAAQSEGARLHVYLEGPGGPTGESWAPDELERIRLAAASVGLRGTDWQARWEAGGWKVYVFGQLRRFHDLGFESAEIDNLYRVEPDPVAFYREYAEWWSRGLVPRAMLKNLDGPEMEAVLAAVPRPMLADFAIFETSAGDPTASVQASARAGIQTVISRNTFEYDAFGDYELPRP